MTKILVVDDNVGLNNGIVMTLKEEGRSFTQCFSISEAEEALANEKFNLILLDVNLPDGNGFDLCKTIKDSSDTPIIFLTANNMELDIVSGLELGAEDYITKPFSLMVLRARVGVVLRRNNKSDEDTSIKIDNMKFDFEGMNFYLEGNKIELSKTEQKLLKVLIRNRGNTLSREILMEKIWDDEMDYVNENALSVTVKRLRDKLEENPVKPKYIKTVYGIGYRWVKNNA